MLARFRFTANRPPLIRLLACLGIAVVIGILFIQATDLSPKVDQTFFLAAPHTINTTVGRPLATRSRKHSSAARRVAAVGARLPAR